VEGESLVTGLEELAVSTGSACNSASAEPSYVLRALGRDSQLAQSSLRFSLGRFTTEADIDIAAVAVRREVTRLRAASPRYARSHHGAGGPSDGQDAPRGNSSEPSGAPLGAPQAAPNRGPEAPALSGLSEAPSTLGSLARHYFRALPGAGSLAGMAGVLFGEAGCQTEGTWVRFSLLMGGDIVKDARFESYGCPHTLAVAAWLTAQLPGRTLAALAPGAPAQWARALEVPVEKLGRLLVIEDALQACLQSQPRDA